MDTLTHALSGYVLAKSITPRDSGRWVAVAGVITSILPDADSLAALAWGEEFYILHHRGITNSLFLAPFLALVLALVFNSISARKALGGFFVLCLVELLAHTFLDLVNSFGTMILSPLSDRRFALDWLFIIDLQLFAIFLIPSVIVAVKNKAWVARVSLLFAAFYMGLSAVNHSLALEVGREMAMRRGIRPQRVEAIPQPLSPFHWAVYVVTSQQIQEGFVTLVGGRMRRPSEGAGMLKRLWSRYQPKRSVVWRSWRRTDGSPWTEMAMGLDGVRRYLWFARLSVARHCQGGKRIHRVVIFDLRFGDFLGRRPFVYEVVLDSEGRVLKEGLRRGSSPGPPCAQPGKTK
jgi:inner membrane protein